MEELVPMFILLPLVAGLVLAIIDYRRTIKAKHRKAEIIESFKRSVPSGKKSVRGQVIARRSGYVCFRTEDGRTLWARSNFLRPDSLYSNTAVGDEGTVLYLGDSALNFKRTGVLEMQDCPAVFEGKAKFLDMEDGAIFRSDAFAAFGGTLKLHFTGGELRELKKGDAGVLSFCGDRLQHFKVTGFRPMEYEDEQKPGPEGSGSARGRFAYIESGESNIGIYLLDNGVLVKGSDNVWSTDSDGSRKRLLPGDYGLITWKYSKLLDGPWMEEFSIEHRLEAKDCSAVLIDKRRSRRGCYLTFYAHEFMLYGYDIAVTCTAEQYAAYNQGDIGVLNIYDRKLLSFVPGVPENTGV